MNILKSITIVVLVFSGLIVCLLSVFEGVRWKGKTNVFLSFINLFMGVTFLYAAWLLTVIG